MKRYLQFIFILLFIFLCEHNLNAAAYQDGQNSISQNKKGKENVKGNDGVQIKEVPMPRRMPKPQPIDVKVNVKPVKIIKPKVVIKGIK